MKAMVWNWLVRLGVVQPGKIMYIGGSDVLPTPPKGEEEQELLREGKEMMRQKIL